MSTYIPLMTIFPYSGLFNNCNLISHSLIDFSGQGSFCYTITWYNTQPAYQVLIHYNVKKLSLALIYNSLYSVRIYIASYNI